MTDKESGPGLVNPDRENPTTIEPVSDSRPSVAPPRRRRRKTRPWYPLKLVDQLAAEQAHCVDCTFIAIGSDARARATNHAGRRNHRVAWVRLAAAEIRPKRWPS